MLTEERVDTIFKEMDGYVLELVPDPTSLGPQYFRDHIAVCRNYLNRVGLVLNELNRERLYVSGELRRQEASYSMEFDNLLTNEASVKNLDSIEDRKAAAGFRLRAERLKINELKQLTHVLDSVYKVVSFRNRELHATMTAVKDQSKMMNAEIRSGSFYGDERTGSSDRSEKRSGGSIVTDDVSAEELAELMAGPVVELEQTSVVQAAAEPAAQQAETQAEPEVMPEPVTQTASDVTVIEDDAAVLDFLDGLADGAPAPAQTEEDEWAFLEGL